MAKVNKRLEDLERKIPQPAPNAPGDADLAKQLIAEIDELQSLGYITPAGDLSPDCPEDRRPMAILGGLLLKGEL